MRDCEECGKGFKPRHKNSRFCSKRCLWDNNKKRVPYNKGKGKGWVGQNGYRETRIEREGKMVTVKEHRLIMEQHLGRKLEPWEAVHHIDGDRLNNNIDNLRVMSQEEHSSEHSTGSRRNYETRLTMQRFALMREELKREREIKDDLVEALEYQERMQNGDASCSLQTFLHLRDAALTKAYGE